ncbi:hypothetical protein VTN96DRAFT_6272 [Rasamsonia emersonii]
MSGHGHECVTTTCYGRMDGWMELWNQHSQESSAVSDADLALAVTLTDFSDTPVSEVRHRANQSTEINRNQGHESTVAIMIN